jgi:hypothetical protein
VLIAEKEYCKHTHLSFWFERLARHLLHCKEISLTEWLSTRCGNSFDIDCLELDALVEVKGSSNKDQLMLFEDQLESQLGELGFPVFRGFILLFSYNNRDSDSSYGRLFPKCGETPEEVSAFLARNIERAYAIDIEIVEAFRRSQGTRVYKWDKGCKRRIVIINRRVMENMAANARNVLLKLGFDKYISKWLPHNARGIRKRKVETVFDGHKITFDLFPILQAGLKRRFLKTLNGNVRIL